MNSDHYTWGEGCEAWKLKDSPELSIIKEKMPSGTSEKFHFHQKAEQLFYILNGTATFLLDGEEKIVEANGFIKIAKEVRHKIMNNSEVALEFLVISHPRAYGDRTDL